MLAVREFFYFLVNGSILGVVLLILSTVIFLNLIVYSTLVGGEHYRYFMHSLAYVFIGGVLIFRKFRL
jgi:hypothetical protein